jgi:hypothetical protein
LRLLRLFAAISASVLTFASLREIYFFSATYKTGPSGVAPHPPPLLMLRPVFGCW